MAQASRPKLIFLITEDWFFGSHFLGRARMALRAGFDVVVASRFSRGTAWIEAEGFRAVRIEFKRGGTNPFREPSTIASIVRLYCREKPALVHHVALKPILYGSIAARLCGVRNVVNAPVGLGYVYTTKDVRVLRMVVHASLRLLLNPKGSKVVFENEDDREAFIRDGTVASQDAVLIRGAGVDIGAIRPQPEPPGELTVLMVARMLASKGVEEFVRAAGILRDRRCTVRFLLAGSPDPMNPTSITEQQLLRWHQANVVDWLGFRDDIPALLHSSHVVALPSYREGLPKALLEAMAAGRPIVAADVPGCRDAVHNGENGILVPARDALALADAIERLLEDKDLRRRMGERGRVRAETEFSQEIIERQTLELYEGLVGLMPFPKSRYRPD